MKKKRKLLITVGAGASIDFGLPSVSAIDTLLDQRASQLCPLAADPTSNLYRYIRDSIDSYYSKSPKQQLRQWVNFEEVLYQLNLLIPYVSDPHHLHGANALLAPINLPHVQELGQTEKPVDGGVLRNLTASLMDALIDHFIDASQHISSTKRSEIIELGAFLDALKEQFDIGIITLNYDNVLTQACPDLHTGFDIATGEFDPLSVFNRVDWGFIYHLHGSIHYAMSGNTDDMHAINWVATPSKGNDVHASGRNAQDSVEGTSYPMSPLVAGYGKTQQILREPFRTYFAQVNRLVHEADSLLFLGYGFGDLHLNALFSPVRNRHRPIVVVDWAEDGQDPLPFRADNWAYQLSRTLRFNTNSMSGNGSVAPVSIGELKADNELEVSNEQQYPLAVWYSGLLAACRNTQNVLSHLA